MQSETFEAFWSKAIVPCCNRVFDEFTATDIETYKPILNIDGEFKNRVFCAYGKYRKEVRESYFNNSKNSLIDRHKICSCLMGALFECRAVSYLIGDNVPETIFLSNYKIAFLSGVRSLYLLRLAQSIHDGKKDFGDLLYRQEMFKFPKTQVGHDEYSMGRIKALALTDSKNKPFDLLAYADMLYWIERFNEENIFTELKQSNV